MSIIGWAVLAWICWIPGLVITCWVAGVVVIAVRRTFCILTGCRVSPNHPARRPRRPYPRTMHGPLARVLAQHDLEEAMRRAQQDLSEEGRVSLWRATPARELTPSSPTWISPLTPRTWLRGACGS